MCVKTASEKCQSHFFATLPRNCDANPALDTLSCVEHDLIALQKIFRCIGIAKTMAIRLVFRHVFEQPALFTSFSASSAMIDVIAQQQFKCCPAHSMDIFGFAFNDHTLFDWNGTRWYEFSIQFDETNETRSGRRTQIRQSAQSGNVNPCPVSGIENHVAGLCGNRIAIDNYLHRGYETC
jgi:hypothetical protein